MDILLNPKTFITDFNSFEVKVYPKPKAHPNSCTTVSCCIIGLVFLKAL